MLVVPIYVTIGINAFDFLMEVYWPWVFLLQCFVEGFASYAEAGPAADTQSLEDQKS
jgi:hypothetical protein